MTRDMPSSTPCPRAGHPRRPCHRHLVVPHDLIPFRAPKTNFASSPAFFLLEQSSSELAPLATAGRNPPPPLDLLSIPRTLSSLTTPSTFPDPHLSSSPAELAETLTLPSAAIGANPSSASLASIRFSDHPLLKSTPRTGSW